jgi:NAD(P)-dependent dehydrogenase (short-subunit alcohol dehydrogenase family)
MHGVGVSVIVMTEAAAPLGQALAAVFARPGVTLILADRDTHALKPIAARCRGLGAKTDIVQADICDTASARKLVNAVRETAGQVDVWISQTARGHDGVTPDVRAVIPVFVKQKRGTLIHLVSGAALPASLRAPLSAHRHIHLCDVHAGDLESDRLARRIAELARAPRSTVRFGANDNMLERILKVGAAVGLATLTGLGGLVSTLESARMG